MMGLQPVGVAVLLVLLQGLHALNGASGIKAHGQTKDSVVAKVVQMLAEEKDKIGVDLKAERVQMDEYLNFCHREQDEKNYEIGQGNRKIEDLTALIEDNTAQIEALDEEIADLGTESAKLHAAQDKEDERRANGTAEFKQREVEQTIMVEELANLETSLEKQMEAMTTPPPVEGSGAAEEDAFLQVDSSRTVGPGFWAAAYTQAKVESVKIQNRMSEVQIPKLTREEARARAGAMLQSLGTDGFDQDTVLHLGNAIGIALTAVTDAVPEKDRDGAFVQEPVAISSAHFDMQKKKQ